MILILFITDVLNQSIILVQSYSITGYSYYRVFFENNHFTQGIPAGQGIFG